MAAVDPRTRRRVRRTLDASCLRHFVSVISHLDRQGLGRCGLLKGMERGCRQLAAASH
jgi:hypothetical protein